MLSAIITAVWFHMESPVYVDAATCDPPNSCAMLSSLPGGISLPSGLDIVSQSLPTESIFSQCFMSVSSSCSTGEMLGYFWNSTILPDNDDADDVSAPTDCIPWFSNQSGVQTPPFLRAAEVRTEADCKDGTRYKDSGDLRSVFKSPSKQPEYANAMALFYTTTQIAGASNPPFQAYAGRKTTVHSHTLGNG